MTPRSLAAVVHLTFSLSGASPVQKPNQLRSDHSRQLRPPYSTHPQDTLSRNRRTRPRASVAVLLPGPEQRPVRDRQVTVRQQSFPRQFRSCSACKTSSWQNVAGLSLSWLVLGNDVRRAIKYLLISTGVFICLVILLLAWSFHADQQNFQAAKNDCERACIQDSGGINQCRQICVSHPDRYP